MNNNNNNNDENIIVAVQIYDKVLTFFGNDLRRVH